MKKTKSVDNKKKTSDLKSGVFSFSESCYKNFSSIAFENEKHKGYALLILNMFYSPTKRGDNFRFFSTPHLKNISSNYDKILKLFEDSLMLEIKRHGSNSIKYIPNPDYHGTCNISEEDFKLYEWADNEFTKKKEIRGLRSNTKNYTLEITEEEIEKELWEYEECETIFETNRTLQESINYQKYLVKELKNNNTKLSQKTNRRCYSNFCNLSSNFHKYFKIAGEDVVEIDGHASFSTFLPLICRKYIRDILNYNKEKYEKLLELYPENKLYKDIVDKNIELITGAEDCIVRFENKLKELFENKLSFYDYLQENISKKYDSCKFKKAVNSFLMSKSQNKVDDNVHEFFFLNYTEICKLVNDMRTRNFFWREAERIEVSVFSNAAEHIILENGHCLTKFDGILVQESLKTKTLHHLYKNFIMLGIYTIFKVIEHKTQTTTKLNLKEAQIVSEEYNEFEAKQVLNNQQADLPSEGTKICLDKKSLSATHLSTRSKGGHRVSDLSSLSRQNTRNRMINMKFMKDGRMSVYVKNKKYVSKKNDTLEDFKQYVFSKIDKEYKNLIIWSERSEVMSEASEIKSLTVEIKDDILVKDERTVDLSLEVDFSQDVVEIGDYTKTSQKAPEEARNDQSEELSPFVLSLLPKRKIA